MRRIWTFVKRKVGFGVPAATIFQSPAKTPAAMSDKTLADAWVRISERERKKAATAATFASMQDLISTMRGEAAKRILRVTTPTATTCHVRAADLLTAQSDKLRDVPLCDPAGDLIPTADPTRRSRVLLADVLAGTVELLPLLETVKPTKTAMSDVNLIAPTMDSGSEPTAHPADAAEYELLPEADAEAASLRGRTL